MSTPPPLPASAASSVAFARYAYNVASSTPAVPPEQQKHQQRRIPMIQDCAGYKTFDEGLQDYLDHLKRLREQVAKEEKKKDDI